MTPFFIFDLAHEFTEKYFVYLLPKSTRQREDLSCDAGIVPTHTPESTVSEVGFSIITVLASEW